jgi:hypothetical protein
MTKSDTNHIDHDVGVANRSKTYSTSNLNSKCLPFPLYEIIPLNDHGSNNDEKLQLGVTECKKLTKFSTQINFDCSNHLNFLDTTEEYRETS